MFIFRGFPDVSDDFLTSYKLAQILSKRMMIGFWGTTTNEILPQIQLSDLPIFNNIVPKHAASIWFGLPREKSTISNKNISYITSWREDVCIYSALNNMDKIWIVGENDFPYPFISTDPMENREGILFYMAAPLGKCLDTVIEAWLLSRCDWDLKILAPGHDSDTLKYKIKLIRDRCGIYKKCMLSTPKYCKPSDIDHEILSSKATIDIRIHKGISYSTLIALSSGIPAIGTDMSFPLSHYIVKSSNRRICEDGTKLTGEIIASYSIDDIINNINNIYDNYMLMGSYDVSDFILEEFQELLY